MTTSSYIGGIVEGVTPDAADPPDSAPTCAECGRCKFSDQSSLKVTIHQISQLEDCTMVDHTSVQTWAFDSQDANRARWEKDASNYVEYDCFLARWRYVCSISPLSLASAGPSCEVPTRGNVLQISSCTEAKFFDTYLGRTFVVFEFDVINNDCPQGA